MRRQNKAAISRVKRRARATGKRDEGRVILKVPRTVGFPDTMVTTLTYYQQIAIAPGAVVGSWVFRGNSLFDPDYTGTGHQPRYFDQFAAIYGQYRVYGSSIDLQFMNNAGTSPGTINVTPNTNILTATTPDIACELPRNRQVTVGVNGVMIGEVISRATTREICGLNKAQIYDTDYSATVGSNPLQIWYWNILAFAFVGTNVSIVANVKLEYHCEFFDRIDTGLSIVQKPELVPKEERILTAEEWQQPAKNQLKAPFGVSGNQSRSYVIDRARSCDAH